MGVEEGIGWRDVGITRKPETREEVILGIQGNGSWTGAGAVRLNGSGSFSLW